MRRHPVVLALVVVAVAACGGDNDGSGDVATNEAQDAADSDADDGDEVETGQSSDFDLGSLPDNFPDELIPPEWDTGQYTEAVGFPTVTFESSMSFDDIIAYYDGVHGESIVVGNDPGERLAQWTKMPPWIVSVFEGDPMMIGISEVPDEE